MKSLLTNKIITLPTVVENEILQKLDQLAKPWLLWQLIKNQVKVSMGYNNAQDMIQYLRKITPPKIRTNRPLLNVFSEFFEKLSISTYEDLDKLTKISPLSSQQDNKISFEPSSSTSHWANSNNNITFLSSVPPQPTNKIFKSVMDELDECNDG